MSSSSSTTNLIFLAVTLISSLLFGTWLDPPAPFTKKDVLRGLESLAKGSEENASGNQKHLLIGFNANLDAIVADGPAFMRSLQGVQEYGATADVKVINTAKEFGEVFLHHFSTASAGERAIGNDTLWLEILDTLDRLASEDIRIGGNAALMSEAVARGFPNVDVSLVGMSGVKLAGRLSKRTKLIGGQEGMIRVGKESFPTQYDQIHLILEYPGGSKFGSYKADRANRFIVSRDFSNGAMAAVEALTWSNARGADALIIAGAHIMDGMISPESRTARLNEVKEHLEYLPKMRLHFELGSTGDLQYTKEMITTLPFDSLGLNEQEFFALCSSLNICKQEDASAMKGAIPPVIKVQAATVALFEQFPRLSRIHFHSYAYHLLAQRTTASAQWPNPQRAVASGSVIATTRACASRVSDLHGNKLSLSVMTIKVSEDEAQGKTRVIELTPMAPVAQFSSKGIDFYLAPVVACTIPKQTVGLGDYISSHALATQL